MPHSPPIAITASPEATTARLRAWPTPVATAWVTYSFASAGSSEGRIPITSPPASRAPREAASITPLRPPQTSTAPASAMPRPTASASWSASPSALAPPITEIWTGRSLIRP